ncbi:MAG: hypothetical protein IK100_08380 [Muribaculaceae bacterium]|nr:hypothetical protein [Muribaculaceae bacterium]
MKKLFILLICISYTTLSFGNSDQYVKVTASSTPTGEGKVYATISSPANTPSYANDSYSTASTALDPGATSQANSIAYLYAQKANTSSNYIFEKWTATSPSGWSSYQAKTSVPITGSSSNTSNSSPKEYVFTASFKPAGVVTAVSNDETRGVVSNSKIDNENGDKITLTAIENIFKGEFKYWTDPNGSKIYDKSFTITVGDNNAGTYTAVFESRNLTQGMYIMLYNENSSKYLGLLGNNDDVATSQRFFRNSILLADGNFAHSSPAFVLKISGTPDDYFDLTNIDFAAQGTSIKANQAASSGQLDFYRIKDGSYHIRGKFYGNIGFMCYQQTATDNGTPTTIEEHYGTIYHPGAFNGAGWGGNTYFWKIAVLTEDEHTHYFGAEPKSAVSFNGKYYTTMYTSFPYKCLDDVNAFIVDRINNDGTIHLKKISDGKVPAETPVILQCSTTEAKTNRLLPIMENVSSLSGTNRLTGEIWIKDYEKQESSYRTRFNNSTMRVLNNNECSFKNVNNEDILASTGEVGTLTYIQNNTCYLDISSVSSSNRKEKYSFEVPAAPVITPESQSAYDSGESVPVTITCSTQGASIKYSTDGDTWLDYQGTLNISDNTSDNIIIYAKAVDPDNDFESEVTTATYSFTPKNVHIADLPNNEDGVTYKIIDPLTVAYVDKNGIIYAKDDNGATEQTPDAEEIDFMEEHYGGNTYSDHSNWLAIDASSVTLPSIREGVSRIDVTGKVLESSQNRRIKASRIEEVDRDGSFNPNTYCVVNFMGSHFQVGQTNFFFAAPQANEIAEVIWAEWAGNDTFVVPSGTGFTGAVNVDLGLYKDDDCPLTLKNGSQYQFIGLVNKLATKDSDYKVYPLGGLKDMTVTGIQNVEISGNVIGVKYYNAMGVASNVPFKGVNIVVTTYDNGARTTSKVIK